MKDYYGDELRDKTPVSISAQDSPTNKDKSKKEKKKKQYKDKRDSTTLATAINKAKVGGRKNKNVSEITYYNYNKKKHYVTKCLKSQKSKY